MIEEKKKRQTPEADLWQRLKPFCNTHKLDPYRVENDLGVGIPDVNLATGWVELKILAEWPKRKSTRPKVPKWTPEQRGWAVKRRMVGGNVWFLIQVGKATENPEVFLFDALPAARWIGKWSRDEWDEHAIFHCPRTSTQGMDCLVRCMATNLEHPRHSMALGKDLLWGTAPR